VHPRPITPAEAAVVQWLLDHTCYDVSAYRSIALQDLQVVGGCSCGCASIDYTNKQMVADEIALYPDGMKAGLILWARAGILVGLEIYEMDPVADRFPAVEHLRRWEDLTPP
jgi:hypothetical protein